MKEVMVYFIDMALGKDIGQFPFFLRRDLKTYNTARVML